MLLPSATLRGLRAVLRLEGVTLRRLSDELEMAPQNVSTALNGRRPMPDTALVRLLDVLGLRLTGDRLDIPSRHVRVWTQAPLDTSPLGEELRAAFDGGYDYALLSPYWSDSSGFVYDQSKRLIVLSKADRAVVAVLSPSSDAPLVRPATAPLHGPSGRYVSIEAWEALSQGGVQLVTVRAAVSNVQPFDWPALIEACTAANLSADAVLACLVESKGFPREVTARLLAQANAKQLILQGPTLAILRQAV